VRDRHDSGWREEEQMGKRRYQISNFTVRKSVDKHNKKCVILRDVSLYFYVIPNFDTIHLEENVCSRYAYVSSLT